MDSMIVKKNRRADKMWSYILPALARVASMQAGEQAGEGLHSLDIIDLGVGHGDFTLRALQAGAGHVVAVDNNVENLQHVELICQRAGISPSRWTSYNVDLSMKKDLNLLFWRSFDVGLCTSVLPYLEGFGENLLYKMSMHCAVSIIECQYRGDGPGPIHIRDDEDMRKWLSVHWHAVQIIGRTELDIRDASRTIWMCAMGKHE